MHNLKDILQDYPDLLTKVLKLKDDDVEGKQKLEEDLFKALGDEGLKKLFNKTTFSAEFRGRIDLGMSPSTESQSLANDPDAFKAPVPSIAGLYKRSGAFVFDLFELPEDLMAKLPPIVKKNTLFDSVTGEASQEDVDE